MGKLDWYVIFCWVLLLQFISVGSSHDNCTEQRALTYDDEVNCHDIDLSYIQWLVSDGDITSITCDHCKIGNLTSFSKFERIEYLNITNSPSFNITIETFSFLASTTRLTSVSVTKSNISHVEDDSFKSRYLKTLNLSFNRIKNISLSSSNLIELNLSFNELESGSFPKTLQDLYLQSNKLIIQQDTFAGLYKLKRLDISNNNLSFLPDHVFSDLTSLNLLNMSHNNLISLDYGSLSGLTNLGSLDISYNSISTIPEYVFLDIHALRSLHLNNNNLTDLDGNTIIANLGILNFISIDENIWNCDVLSRLIRLLRSKKINILQGDCKTTPSISKICCLKNGYSSTASNDFQQTDDALSSIRNFFDRDFTNTKFYKFFTKDYKQENFWKYFDADYKQDGLFKFFDGAFLQSQFYRYFNRNFFNVTLQNKIIDKIENISRDENGLNVTELKGTLKGLFNDFFHTLNYTNTVEPLVQTEPVTHDNTTFKLYVLIAITITIIILLVLYIILDKCKVKLRRTMFHKVRCNRIFKYKVDTISEPEVEIM